MRLTSAAATHQGLRRTDNQDTYLADDQLGLYVVCDGMGGHRHGALAAKTARDVFVQSVRIGQTFEVALRNANLGVMAIEGERTKRSPGSTLTALRVTAESIEVGHAGDSEAYLLGPAIMPLVRSHTLWDGSLINFCGIGKDFEPELRRVTVPSDPYQVLVASDGLSRHVDPGELAQLWRDVPTLELPGWLIGLCLARGGVDNVTVVAVEVGP